jgi:glycerol-3-phosphate dehydrogenase (NAD(P)+)
MGGAGKNVIAIAAGMSDALGLGASALAGLVTRGLNEISRVGIALGAKPQTFMGLSGMGDLALTCFSDLSRNRRLGQALGEGKSVGEAENALGQVAEGIHAANEIKELAKRLEVEVPITTAVTRVLSNEISPDEVAKELFARIPKSEI